MKMHSIFTEQILPLDLDKAWDFFSSPHNLNEITPSDMSFHIKSELPKNGMYEGMFIEYSLRPVLNLPVTWLTEITHIKDQCYFMDEQRVGPYALWHHEHHFEAHPKGVKMTDKLYYALPFGPIGNLAHALFVGKRVRDIFEFRFKKLEELFPMPKS